MRNARTCVKFLFDRPGHRKCNTFIKSDASQTIQHNEEFNTPRHWLLHRNRRQLFFWFFHQLHTSFYDYTVRGPKHETVKWKMIAFLNVAIIVYTLVFNSSKKNTTTVRAANDLWANGQCNKGDTEFVYTKKRKMQTHAVFLFRFHSFKRAFVARMSWWARLDCFDVHLI